ncbi:hypothetical protein NIES2111_63440 (plasmid) [Nostoc sp. NIES-2111]|nr:hypothetical protein NIES2111_63440 [Nostoc sp. NIES-2111]
MDLPKEYPLIHIYTQQGAHQPVIIKGNTEGLCVLINALVTAIAQGDCNGVAEVFDGDAEVFEVRVQIVNNHDEVSPVPYKELQQ